VKIVFLHNVFFPHDVGGAEKSLFVRAKELSAMGHRCTVVTVSVDEDRHEYDYEGIRVIAIALPWSRCSPFYRERGMLRRALWHGAAELMFPWFGRRIVSEILRLEPDVVNTVNLAGISTSVWRALKKKSIRVVHTVADYNLLCAANTMFKKNRACTERCYACKFITFKKYIDSAYAQRVVYISHWVRSEHERAGYFRNANYATVIHNAEYMSRHYRRNENDKTDSPLRFGYIGQIQRMKGVGVLLDAFFTLKGRSDWTLEIAGIGPRDYVEELQERTRNDTRFVWLGKVPPDAFYQSVDVVIVPSLWNEPLGRVPFEANSRGIPVIVSAKGGLKEIVVDGETGWIVDIEDGKSLTSLLEILCSKKREIATMAEACRRRASLRHNPSRVADEYLKAFYS
jgi:glycosyltransferase involved in cell wall biosynthesis